MKIEEPPSPKKTSRSSKTTLWRLKSIHKASDHLDLCYSKVWTILHGLTRQRTSSPSFVSISRAASSAAAQIKWPPYSPDLDFLDYFWLYAMINVRRCKPATIEELGAVVISVARTFPDRMIRTAVANVQKSMHPGRRGPL